MFGPGRRTAEDACPSQYDDIIILFYYSSNKSNNNNNNNICLIATVLPYRVMLVYSRRRTLFTVSDDDEYKIILYYYVLLSYSVAQVIRRQCSPSYIVIWRLEVYNTRVPIYRSNTRVPFLWHAKRNNVLLIYRCVYIYIHVCQRDLYVRIVFALCERNVGI